MTTEAAPVEPLERSIVRLADAIGSLNPSGSRRRAEEIATVPFSLPGFPPLTMGRFCALVNNPVANEVISAKCNHCDRQVTTRRIVAPFVACDECLEKITAERKLDLNKRYWEKVCPERFRETNLNHESFPRAIWTTVAMRMMPADPIPSLFLFGPTGTCKTRMAFLALKRCLLRDQRVGVLWPEKLNSLVSRFDTATFDHYAEYDVLLMDDTLLAACREPKLVDAVKQLVDVRLRHNRPMIITSQIGEAGALSGKEYGEVKEADVERIAALMRRLREVCAVIPCANPKPTTPGEQIF